MPRKKLIYTHEFPYHIVARSNNKEWFYIDKNTLWKIFISNLNELSVRYSFQIHSFVLMDNHYHMLATTSSDYNLGFIMQRLQQSVSKTVNGLTGRTNHLFGGPYKASLITNSSYFMKCLSYVLQNPVQAGITKNIEQYHYSSSIGLPNSFYKLTLSSPLIYKDILENNKLLFEEIQNIKSIEQRQVIQRALKKTVFVIKNRSTRR